MTSSPSGRDRVFAWMTANYDAITALIPTDVASYLPFLVSGCSEERLAAAEMFFDSPEHQVGGSQRNMIKVADAVNDCVVLRKREGAGVRDFLAGRFNSGAR